ncbi:hypothetical protein A2Z22_02475 [Candidatus Woesebacteria bacterium RBG_16_34_12]|uniref:Uncharacterized protein n=1 Tax=Candidatus Woesebacteria bacterium RBG_16_34_12 TaxID=1802480 RepID=A0A1F7XBV0_9BACT|nr:MAG: hypothetical protein A2Z22_02475 [Candidatus Woesebacteria bacterium RBG_16_34_12]
MEAVMKSFSFIVMIALIVILSADFLLAWNVKHTLQALVENSPLIVIGKVLQVTSTVETEKEREVIYTYATIETESLLNGELDEPALTVKMLGGNVGNKGCWSEEWIPFKRDEEILIFLHSENKTNNIWKMKSISGKLSVVSINGIRYFDCSMLRTDEVSQYYPNPYFEQKVIIDRINDYLLAKKGGK